MKTLKRVGIALAALIVAYYAIGGVLYLCGFRIYQIPSSAMEPTIRKGEMVIGRISESYRSNVERFDIAVYRLPQAPGEIYAKRVAALAGEHVAIGKDGMSVGGKKLSLPYPVVSADRGMLNVTIPAGSIYVVGDNTSNSMDSRYHGPVPLSDVLGYLVFKK